VGGVERIVVEEWAEGAHQVAFCGGSGEAGHQGVALDDLVLAHMDSDVGVVGLVEGAVHEPNLDPAGVGAVVVVDGGLGVAAEIGADVGAAAGFGGAA